MSFTKSHILPLTLAVAVGLFGLTSFLTAQPPVPAAPPAGSAEVTPEALKRQQEANAKLYKDLEQAMLRLAQRLEKSDRPDDQARAQTIRKALDVSGKEGINQLFQRMVANYAKTGNPTSGEVGGWIGEDVQLRQALTEILNILMSDDETAKLKAKIARLKEFLKEAQRIKRAQEIIQARTDAQREKAERIAKDQRDLAEQTKDLAARMGGQKPSDKQGNKNPGGEPKQAEPKPQGKPGDQNAENKNDTAEPKSSDKDPQAGKEPSGKEPGKEGPESKPAADPKAGGEAKEGGDPKAGDPKEGEPKSGEPQAAEPKAGKPGEGKGQGEGKGSGKPSEGQAGEGKPMGGEPSKSQGSSKPPSSQGSQGSQSSPSQPPPPQQPQDDTPGRKEVKEAYPEQKNAEDNLNKEKKTEASKNEDKAIEALAKAIKELEKRLKQLREEEMLKLLANLEARCNNMLRMQIEVYENTKSIHSGIVKNNNQKTESDRQRSQVQGDKENEIVMEADKALRMLEGEGSAVAFAGVLAEAREDMKAVKVRLGAAYVDTDTQQIEKDIIDQLKEMIAALKKAQQDVKSGQGQPGQPGKPGNQPLIDKLAELKLMRALQAQVNSRTTMHSKRYSGEQAKDPILQAELRQMSERQAKIQDMLHKLATGANQ